MSSSQPEKLSPPPVVGDAAADRFLKRLELHRELDPAQALSHGRDCAARARISATGGHPETFAGRCAVDNCLYAADHSTSLLERDRELAAFDGLIEAAVSGVRASFVVVIGPAGIGKTRFLAPVEQRAGSAGLASFARRGRSSSGDLASGERSNCSRLRFAPRPISSAAELLEGAAGWGASCSDSAPRGPDRPHGDPSFAAFHGLYWLCVNLAARRRWRC